MILYFCFLESLFFLYGTEAWPIGHAFLLNVLSVYFLPTDLFLILQEKIVHLNMQTIIAELEKIINNPDPTVKLKDVQNWELSCASHGWHASM